jgi:septum formation protein
VSLLGLAWRAAPADIDESAYLLEDALVGALNTAAAKAHLVQGAADEVILAADTLVVVDGEILGKPVDADGARRMLERLRGRAHQVLTGVALRAPNDLRWGGVVSTRVVIRAYSDVEVDAYVSRGEPFDKAGGYAVQDEVFRPVERLEGCYLNVVGLPLCAVAAGLTAVGVLEATRQEKPPCRYCQEGRPLVSVR